MALPEDRLLVPEMLQDARMAALTNAALLRRHARSMSGLGR